MRLRKNPQHKDGSPGSYYLRVRIAYHPHLKPILKDIPLETNNKGIATQRAGFLLRSFVRAGRQVMGDLTAFQDAAPPRKGKKKHRNAEYTPLLPLFLPQKKD